jgi:hypothetical protein
MGGRGAAALQHKRGGTGESCAQHGQPTQHQAESVQHILFCDDPWGVTVAT